MPLWRYSFLYSYKASVKRIQHFTEQRSTILLGEMLYSFQLLVASCSVLIGADRCCSVLLGAARCCSVLLDTALPCLMEIKNVGRVIKIVRTQSLHGIILFRFFMEHCVGANKTQEMLAEMFD